MPIRPEYRAFYNSLEWQSVRARILKRAKNKCEQCGKPNRATVMTVTFPGLPAMFWRPLKSIWPWWRNSGGHPQLVKVPKPMIRTIKVQIGVAHVRPYDPTDPATNHESNLKAWCGWCHLHHDAPLHKENRIARKDAARPILGGTSEAVVRRRRRKTRPAPRASVIQGAPLFDGTELAN